MHEYWCPSCLETYVIPGFDVDEGYTTHIPCDTQGELKRTW